jgi:hypothetical protein
MRRTDLLINFALVIVFFLVAIALLKKPELFGLEYDTTSAATLCGAMLGAGALLIGNQLNYMFQANAKNVENQQQREALITILMSEIVSIYIPHIQFLQQLKKMASDLEENKLASFSLTKAHKVSNPVVFQTLIQNILITLKKNEIDALVNTYDNLTKTRDFVNQFVDNQKDIGILAVSLLQSMLKDDLDNAAKIVELFAPKERIKLWDKNEVVLLDLLKNPSLHEL